MFLLLLLWWLRQHVPLLMVFYMKIENIFKIEKKKIYEWFMKESFYTLLCGVWEVLLWNLEKMSNIIENFIDYGKVKVELNIQRLKWAEVKIYRFLIFILISKRSVGKRTNWINLKWTLIFSLINYLYLLYIQLEYKNYYKYI